jgi:hypothetical protein
MDMPVYKNFEDLPVWKLAKDLAVKIYQTTKNQKFRRDYSLVELIQFLYIAKGSLGEVRSQLQVSSGLGYINEENFSLLLQQTYDLSKQLGAFISSLRKRV